MSIGMCCGCPSGFVFDDNWNCVEESECKCLDHVTNEQFPVSGQLSSPIAEFALKFWLK